MRVVVLGDAACNQATHRVIDGQWSPFPAQDGAEPSAHAVVAAGVGDEPRLVRRILAAVGKDQQPLLAVVAGLVAVFLGKPLDQTLGDDAYRRRSAERDRRQHVPRAGRAPAYETPGAGRRQSYTLRIHGFVGREGAGCVIEGASQDLTAPHLPLDPD
jgi:hypothetical protein